MIYLILLLVILFCSALMDTTNYISAYFKKKGYKKLAEWTDSDSWENKWHLRDWLVEKGLPKWLADWLAADVLVVFTDGWHFFKAVMMANIQYMVAVLSVAWVNSALVTINFPITHISIGWLTFVLFLVGGQIFNFFFYQLRKL